MKRVYLDHNATTPLRAEVRQRYEAVLDRLEGNPSSVHRSGREARALLDSAREQVAAALAVHEDEIVFTAGGTEADNLAILGGLRRQARGRALVTSAIEHSAVLAAGERARAEGYPLVLVGVDAQGRVAPEEVRARAAAQETGLVSVMAANNEVGSLAPLGEIAAALEGLGGRAGGPAGRGSGDPGGGRALLHSDAVQALGKIPLALRAWGLDLASFSAHKVGGPLGVGVLYKRKGIQLEPLLYGGGQEGALRPGTENVPALVAAALAIELAVREQPEHAARMRALCAACWSQVQLVVPLARLHGPPIDSPERLPNTLNLALPGLDGRVLVARLDLEGLEASAGSACASGSLEPSHVLLAMGLGKEDARAGLRLSFGRTNSAQDVHTAVEILRRTFSSPR